MASVDSKQKAHSQVVVIVLHTIIYKKCNFAKATANKVFVQDTRPSSRIFVRIG